MTRTRIAAALGGVGLVSLVGGIAAAQDPVGIVQTAWDVGGPIAAVVAIMLLASGVAIRTLWNQLQAERRDLKLALEQRTIDLTALVREMRDVVAANTAALTRIADQREAEIEEAREARRHRS